jgi:hypothetical protein
MPRQNRVTPFSALIATSARGTFMGTNPPTASGTHPLPVLHFGHLLLEVCNSLRGSHERKQRFTSTETKR